MGACHPAISPFPDIEFMPKPTEFVQHVVETMRDFGAVRTKAMFGGWGFWHDEVFFALIVDDTLYLKTDDTNRAEFTALGLEAFVYSTKEGERHAMSYLRAPDDALESAPAMRPWLRSALGASLRVAAGKRPASARKRKPSAPPA